MSPFRERVAAYTQLRQEIIARLLENGIDPNADDGREFRNQLASRFEKRVVRLNPARSSARRSPATCGRWCGTRCGANRKSWRMCRRCQACASTISIPRANRLRRYRVSLLQRLEPLPQELQYRFLATALILLDIDTALIVDFLPNAIPAELLTCRMSIDRAVDDRLSSTTAILPTGAVF